MSIAIFLKSNLKNIHPRIGEIINTVPYSLRPGLGSIYRKRKVEIQKFKDFPIEYKQEFIFTKVKYITQHAYRSTVFYKDFYDKEGFHPNFLNKFDDIEKIPIVTKAVLDEYNIEARSVNRKGRYLVNTGGSSGTPFSFYIEPSSMGHEWAHMHFVWEKLGYKTSDLKIVFGGRSDLEGLVEYDVVRNHFAINIYAEYKLVANELKAVLKKYKISYLHGYPSSIYDFAIFCKTEDTELQEALAKNLKGVFLGSEYPHQRYREVIESTFKVDTISWYGHTERAVLAYEGKEKFKYEPFGTYGFAEAVKNKEGDYQLLGTSYYNFASPLIRYNTQDTIANVDLERGILKSFQVTKGREGEFVLDINNKKINLTGLIFGRHHDLFNHSKFIQVKQLEAGNIEIHFVSNVLNMEQASELFDKRNLNLNISFVKRDEPFRTKSGKINLLIK
jgi:phenylacetate-CoA ligase